MTTDRNSAYHPRLHPLAAAMMLALTAGAAGAATIQVDENNCTLVNAINSANSNTAVGGCTAGDDADDGGDVITLTTDVTLTQVNNTNPDGGNNGLPLATTRIRIEGNGHRIARASGQGTPQFRLLNVTASGDLTLDNATIQNGDAGDYSGGGALLNSGVATLDNTTVTGNRGYYGGGLKNDGIVTVAHSAITANSAGANYIDAAGGLVNSGTATITGSTFTKNSESGTGGIVNFGDATLSNSTGVFSANGALFAGGIKNKGTLTLTNSIVSGNKSLYGGGGIQNDGTLVATGTRISGNTGSRAWGGFSDSGCRHVDELYHR